MAVEFGKKEDSNSAEKGINNGPLYAPENDFIYNDYGTTEKVIKGPCNSWIVFGRDRLGDVDHGYGSKGDPKASAMDIVVGRLSSVDALLLNDPEAGIKEPINASTSRDAARIYLSQKADIDDYFNLADGISGKSIAKSAIAVKADDVRVISRNSLKLITRSDTEFSVSVEGRPVKSISITGVQLIAGNESDSKTMQPIPKGTNLKDCLDSIILQIRKLGGVLNDFISTQSNVNHALLGHDHISMYPGTPTSPSPILIDKITDVNIQMFTRIEANVKKIINNLVSTQAKFLIGTGSRYINSSYHHLN